MYKVARLDDAERQTLFRNTAGKMKLNEAVVEKDFWVCILLDYLFHHYSYKDTFTFKGGTSLSKGYGLIKRFSEDIDLILDWRVLGYSKEEPWLSRSNIKQEMFNREINLNAERFIIDKLLPDLRNGFSAMLNRPVDLEIDNEEHQSINFNYPHTFSSEYILQAVKLEIGPLAAWTPAKEVKILSYAAEQYHKIFTTAATNILTVTPERTFWEKATILHQEANRPVGSAMPSRYSRHYYDMYCIAQSHYKNEALVNVDLLRRVAEFKMKFYPRKWVKYEEAAPGTLKLYPAEYSLKILRMDYAKMADMFYGAYPDFDEMMASIKLLEDEINNLQI